MPRRKKMVGVRQNLQKDRLTEFGDLAAERVRKMAPLPGSTSKGRAGRNGQGAVRSAKRLAAVWAEQDADREMHGNAADEHLLTGMEGIGAK